MCNERIALLFDPVGKEKRNKLTPASLSGAPISGDARVSCQRQTFTGIKKEGKKLKKIAPGKAFRYYS